MSIRATKESDRTSPRRPEPLEKKGYTPYPIRPLTTKPTPQPTAPAPEPKKTP